MTKSLKRKTVSGVMWSGIERFSLQGIQFIFNIIIARLLTPSDFGAMAMLTVFLQVSQTFVDAGFTNALIQKKNRTENDFFTVFYFNIFIALLFYIILYIIAPFISVFYNIPLLTDLMRVVAITLIINSLSAIHKIKLTILIDFKTQAKISFYSAFSSGILGAFSAYYGYGVWSLVIQTITNATISTIYLWIVLKWKPIFTFSFKSFNSLFSFGSKLLISSLISTIYRNLYPIFIGKKFSASELGSFSNAELFSKLPSSNISSITSRVMYPILVSVQDDNVKLASVYRRYIRIISFITFPLMMWMVVMAKPLVLFLLTEKWHTVIPLLQILCFDWMFDHLSIINLNLLLVKGRSDLSLKLEILKKTIAIIILIISINWGIKGVCLGRVVYSLIATVLNTYYTKNLIGLSLGKQLRDIYPYFIISIFMGSIVYWINFIDITNIFKLFIGIFIGISFYIFISIIFCKSTLQEFYSLMKK